MSYRFRLKGFMKYFETAFFTNNSPLCREKMRYHTLESEVEKLKLTALQTDVLLCVCIKILKAWEAALASGIFTVKGYKSILSAQTKSHPTYTNQIDLNDIFCSHDDEDGTI